MYCSLSHVQHSLIFLIHALIYAMRFLRYCHCSMSTVWWSTVRGRLDSEKCKFQLWAVFFASNIFTAFFLLVETNPWVSLCRTRKYENGLQGEVYFSLFFYNIFYDFLFTKVRALIFHNFCGKQVQKMKAHCEKKKKKKNVTENCLHKYSLGCILFKLLNHWNWNWYCYGNVIQ